MNKRMRELQALILQKTGEAEKCLQGETQDVEKASAILDEVDKYQKEFEALERVEAAKKAGVPTTPVENPENKKADGVKAFADAARSRFKAMNEGTPADGGYTVPEDISTKVNKYAEERFSLRTQIDYEHVTTNKGRRTYQTRAQHTGFTEVAEGGKIGKVSTPKFEIMTYEVKKYAGYLPVTNELLADSDAAMANTVIEWLGEEKVATENAQIISKVNEKAATVMSGIDDIKKAVNVTLAAFAGSVRIVTNSDGLNYLDTLKDANKRPLLSPDPVKPMEMTLSCGVRRIPVVVVPNDVLQTSEGKIPFIVGDLKAYMKEFDRQQMTVRESDVAAIGELNAFEQDLTIWRAILRADWRVKDAAAIVRGELTPA